jgi:Flp pilus assembly protein TadD
MKRQHLALLVLGAALSACTNSALLATQDESTARRTPSAATPNQSEAAQLVQAAALIKRGQPQRAIDLVDPVIARFVAENPPGKRLTFSPTSPAETRLYQGFLAEKNQDGVVLGPEPGLAVYLKGFALLELKDTAQARTYLELATRLAPANSQYLSELGHLEQVSKNWARSLELFTDAESYAKFGTPETQRTRRTRALRGQGFSLIELGRLDEAEDRFNKCLALDSGDERARRELRYIADLRAKRARSSS